MRFPMPKQIIRGSGWNPETNELELGLSTYNAQSHDVKQLFGLDLDAKWPDEGLPEREIQGFKCWVRPLAFSRTFKTFHRAVAECPVCRKTISIGRIHQHMTVHEK